MNTVIYEYKNKSIISNNIYMEKNYILKQIGKNIQKCRIAQGYTQETFSELMGVSWSYVAKIESGILNLSVGKINEFANFLQVDINELLEINSTTLDHIDN